MHYWKQVTDVDVVLHALLPDLRETASCPCLKENGLLISLKGPVPQNEAARFNARGADMGVRPNSEQLKRVADLLQDGTFNITVTNIYPLEQVSDAHAQIEKGHTRGKIVLKVP